MSSSCKSLWKFRVSILGLASCLWDDGLSNCPHTISLSQPPSVQHPSHSFSRVLSSSSSPSTILSCFSGTSWGSLSLTSSLTLRKSGKNFFPGEREGGGGWERRAGGRKGGVSRQRLGLETFSPRIPDVGEGDARWDRWEWTLHRPGSRPEQ